MNNSLVRTYTANFLGFTIEIEIDKKELKEFLAGLLRK